MRTRRAISCFALLLAGAIISAVQATFEETIRKLSSNNANERFEAARLLKDAAYPEAALPLAQAVMDPDDAVQLEAIAAELNIFLAEKVVTKKKVGLVVEVRNKIVAEAAFSAGPLAIGPRPVPKEVLAALRSTMRDDNPRIGAEAMYAFGALAFESGGRDRRELLGGSGPELAAFIGSADPVLRLGAIRVIGRLFAPRPQDEPVDTTIGDAVIVALNETEKQLSAAAMQSLGALRYERGVQALTDLYQHYGQSDQGLAALDALAHIAHVSSEPLFQAALSGKSSAAKAIAIDGLVRIGHRDRLADINAAVASDRNEAVQFAGSFAAVRFNSLGIDPLIAALKGKRRDQARDYLVEVAAQGRRGEFSRFAQDPDPRLRADVADILGLAFDPAALPIVEPLMKDTDPQVILAAERAVARLQSVRRST